MKLLMHICCSNCCLFPLENCLIEGIDITGLWFNPNIHPYTEYLSRLDSLKNLQNIWKFNIEYIDEYDLDMFLKCIVGSGKNRCEICYSLRLDRTAQIAKKMGLKGFTTSLLASPYQKFDKIIEIGNEAAKKYGLSFYVKDFRKGWKATRSLVYEFELYKQKYCGCVYSEMERYLIKK